MNKTVLILLLLVFTSMICVATTTTTLLPGGLPAASTAAGRVWHFTSHGEQNYMINLCNHIDGCTLYEPDVNISINVTKDYTVEILPRIINFSDVGIYIPQLENNYGKLVWLIVFMFFILGVVYLGLYAIGVVK